MRETITLLLFALCATPLAQSPSINVSHALVQIQDSPSAADRRAAAESLRQAAVQSDALRGEIIARLSLFISKPPNYSSPSGPRCWGDAARLLGHLRAISAIPILVANISMRESGGMSLSLSSQPAAAAIVEIGTPTIPALTAAICKGGDEPRITIAEALSAIGGADAVRALRTGLSCANTRNVHAAMEANLVVAVRGR